jgi:hypothetical protein
MSMASRLVFSVACLGALTATASGQLRPLYVTDGDSQRLTIVQDGAVVAIKQTFVRGYPIAVNATAWIGDYNGAQPDAHEFDLSGDPTGITAPYAPILAVDAGSTGGTTYQLGNAFSPSSTVYECDFDLQNPTPLFEVTGNDLVGITYDSAAGSIWVSDQSTMYEYTTGGSLLSSFIHQSGRGCIAYEPSSDTIWYVTNGTDTITQYGKDGSVLQTLSVSGLASNNWGAEFSMRVGDECYPDFDGSGELDLFDFLAYVNAFNDADPRADCDENGSFDFFDFLCFTNAFNEGC